MECIYQLARWVSHVNCARCHYRMTDKNLTWILMSLLSPNRHFIILIDIHNPSILLMLISSCLWTCPNNSRLPLWHGTLFGITLTIYGFDHSIATSLFLVTIGRLSYTRTTSFLRNNSVRSSMTLVFSESGSVSVSRSGSLVHNAAVLQATGSSNVFHLPPESDFCQDDNFKI